MNDNVAIIVKSSPRKVLNTGRYQGILRGIYDVGTHYSEKFGKSSRRLVLSWEIVGQKLDDGSPYTMSKTFTYSLNQKATLREAAEAMLDRPLVEKEIREGVNIATLIGKNCELRIQQRETDAGPSASIKGFLELPKSAKRYRPTDTCVFRIGMEIPEGTPQFIRDMITKSDEYKSRSSEGTVSEAGGSGSWPAEGEIQDEEAF